MTMSLLDRLLDSRHVAWVSTVVGILAVLLSTDLLWPLLKWIVVITVGVTGFLLGLSMVLCSGKRYTPPTPSREPSPVNTLLVKMMEARASSSRGQKKVVFSKNLDLAIQEIMDYVTRDYVMNWYTTLGKDADRFTDVLHADLWYVLEQFSNRLRGIEHVRFMSQDVTTAIYKHFQNIRIANTKPVEGEACAKFVLPPWLVSESREVEYLRKVAAVFCLHLLPPHYASCSPGRHLLTEILTNAVFKVAIDFICDPDYFNQKLVGWFLYREQLSLEHKRTYTYAATYEDFMRMIDECENIEHLREMRFNIISEIMHATTIQNLKRARGQDTDKEFSPKGTTKGDLLRARNLTRYINQLTVTKSHCEKRICLLGGPDYKSYTSDLRREEQELLPGRKILSFPVIMENETARKHFMKYLHRDDNDSLLRFWVIVEKMRNSHRRHLHELGSDAYQMFIAHPTSLIRLKLDRSTIKGMEAFMIGNTGPDAFYEAQTQMAQILEEKFYPSYIVSDVYHRYITQDSQQGIENKETPDPKRSPRTPEKEESGYAISKHSTYAQQKLQALDEKIANKTQALHALKLSQKADKKILQLQEGIEREIEALQSERRQIEFHIDRTDVWVENLGRWNATIYNSEVVQEEQGMVPYFVILVHIAGISNPKEHTQGWVVSRKLPDFDALHEQLVQIFPEYKKRKLPSSKKLRLFRSIDTEFLNKAKTQLEEYLRALLEDERAAQSEAAFAFFSPSPEHLKFAPAPLKKNKFSIGNLLKGKATQNQDSDSDDDFIFVDPDGLKEEKVKDSIAKPLYMLLNEVFELRGMFKWLRRTLMVFVKVSYGRSINRQVRDTVEWIISEPMLIYYLDNFKEAYWPNGEQAALAPPRTDEEKLRTRMLAKEKFLGALMGRDALKNLFGEQNTRQGTIKMFEALQDIRLNKHLFYELLELFLYELFPELERPEAAHQEDQVESTPQPQSQSQSQPVLNPVPPQPVPPQSVPPLNKTPFLLTF